MTAKKTRPEPPNSPVRVTPEFLKSLALPAMLAGFFLIFYFQLLTGAKFLWEDFTEQAFPNVNFAANCIKQGWIPLWTPYIFGGMPFASDPQATLFYPPYWLYLLFSTFTQPGGVVYTWYILLHILLLGIGAFILGRGLGLRRSASALTATTLMFAGFVSLHVFHTFVFVAAWFPLAFHFLRKGLDTGMLRSVVLAGLMLGFSTLGGYPQYSMHIVYFCAAWTAFSWIASKQFTVNRALKTAIYFGVFAGIGLAMALVQYLPSFEHMAQSMRETMTFEESSKGAITLSRLTTLIVPAFFGAVGGSMGNQSPYWGFPGQSYFFWETCIFVGIVPLFLALRALMNAPKNPRILFLGITALLCVLLALGAATPLYWLVFNTVPGFKSFRIPGRFAFMFAICIALLAGMGLDLLMRSDAKERKRFFIAASVLAMAIILPCLMFYAGIFDAGSQYLTDAGIKTAARNAVGGALLTVFVTWGILAFTTFKGFHPAAALSLSIITFIELFSFGHTFNEGSMNNRTYYNRFNLSPLKTEMTSGSFRVQGRIYRGDGAGEMLFPRNLGNVAGIPLVDGYNQLKLTRWNDLMFNVNDTVGRSLFNVRYLKVPGANQLMRIAAAPRFFLSTSYTVISDRKQVIEHLNSPAFMAGRDVVLEKDPGLTIQPGQPHTEGIRVISENPNRIELEVNAPVNGILSISEMYYPAWKSTVDGKKTEVLAANCAFRAIPLTQGNHRIVMYYQSDAMTKGAIAALGALAFALVILLGRKVLPKRVYEPWMGEGRS